MNHQYNRRQVCQIGLRSVAGLALLGLAGCGGASNAPASPTQLQLVFWGAASRDKLTKQAINLFQQHNPNVKITSQFADFTSYWNKLNTQVASGTLPDLIQMDMRYIKQYVSRSFLYDLSPFISDKTIDLSGFDEVLIAGSKVNNLLYGVPLGGNYQCLVYDTTLVEKAGASTPSPAMTWDQYAIYTASLAKALGNGIYGSQDASGDLSNFEIWVRQFGKELYTEDGKLAFTADDVAGWFNLWGKMRQTGGCVPADVQATFANASGPANSPLIHGKSVFVLPHSNEFEAYTKLTKNKLALSPMPLGSGAGMYLKVSMLMSISSKTKAAKDAASFINFLINDPGGVKALGLDRGMPGGAKATDVLRPTLTPAQQAIIDYVNVIAQSGQTRPKTIIDPPNAGKVQDALNRAAQSVSFGKASVTAGAQAFYSEAQSALAQS